MKQNDDNFLLKRIAKKKNTESPDTVIAPKVKKDGADGWAKRTIWR